MRSGWGRFLLYFAVALLFLCTGVFTAAAGDAVQIELDGEMIEYDVSPYIDENDRTIVPVRFVSEALGYEVEWDRKNRRVEIAKSDLIVELWVDSETAQVNGQEVRMDTTAVLDNGRTMVPIRFVAETFGLEVDWEGETKTVLLHTVEEPGEEPPAEPGAYSIEEAEGRAVVTTSVLNVREGPDENTYEVISRVEEGTELEFNARSRDWYRVRLPEEDREGWVAGWLLELEEKDKMEEEPEKEKEEQEKPSPPDDKEKEEFVPPEERSEELPEELLYTPDSALIMKETVNLRSGPGEERALIGEVKKGQWLEVLEKENGWYRVRHEDGPHREGWLAGWLVAPRFTAEGAETLAIGGNEDGSEERIGVWRSRPTSIGDRDSDAPELPLVRELFVERSGEALVIKIHAESALELPRSFRLDNPSRLVFDFRAKLQEEDELPSFNVEQEGVPVQEVRTAQFDEQTTRLVLDLRKAASHQVRRIDGGNKVEIRVEPFRSAGQTVVIDPGHGSMNSWGGTDPGATGPSGIAEREVVMEISLRLGERLQEKGISTIFTRLGDTSLDTSERAAVANISGSALLLSVHANATYDRSVSGTMTFYHVPVDDLKNQLKAREKLAERVQEELVKALGRDDKGVRTANFSLLRHTRVPAALAEVAFISNPEEEQLLNSPGFQEQAAQALARGIESYLAETGGPGE